MQQKSMGLIEFQRKFATEKACQRHLFRLRWPDGCQCPRCSYDKASFHSTRHLYQCKRCKYQVSLTAGTIFHKTRTPLRKWFWMIFLLKDRLEEDVVSLTDGWPAYNVLNSHPGKHQSVVVGSGKNAPKILPWVHTVIANVKGNIHDVHHGVRPKHLRYYLNKKLAVRSIGDSGNLKSLTEF